MLVLVGEQDDGYGEVIEELLRAQSHRVVLAASPESLVRFLQRTEVSLVILSADFAGTDIASVTSIIGAIKGSRPTPVIITGEELSAGDMAECLAAGADDCVQRAFHPSEFAARLAAIVRRYPRLSEGSERHVDPEPEEQGPPGSGLPEFDRDTLRVRWDGTDIACSRTEFEILQALVEARGRVLTHAYLNRRVWDYPILNDATLLKGHVSAIRAKFRRAGIHQPLIRTVNGVGYGLSHETERLAAFAGPASDGAR